jgi:hypothetical protein
MGVYMNIERETPEQKRDRLKQQELKGNPMGNMNDAFNRANSGVPTDSIGSIGWKATGILILVITIGYIVVASFIK